MENSEHKTAEQILENVAIKDPVPHWVAKKHAIEAMELYAAQQVAEAVKAMNDEKFTYAQNLIDRNFRLEQEVGTTVYIELGKLWNILLKMGYGNDLNILAAFHEFREKFKLSDKA